MAISYTLLITGIVLVLHCLGMICLPRPNL